MCEVRDILEVLLVHSLDRMCIGLTRALGGCWLIKAWGSRKVQA